MNKVICSHCGSTNVLCEAMINPNNKSFNHYTDESFECGCCKECDKNTPLISVTENLKKIDELIKCNEDGCNAVSCTIVFKDSSKVEDVIIKLDTFVNEATDNEVFFYCNSVDEFKSLCDFSGEDFVVFDVYNLIEV